MEVEDPPRRRPQARTEARVPSPGPPAARAAGGTAHSPPAVRAGDIHTKIPGSRIPPAKAPPSKPTASRAVPSMGAAGKLSPSRKIRSMLPHSSRLAETQRSTAPAGTIRAVPRAHRASRPEEAPYRPGPGAPPAICRLPEARPKCLVYQRHRDSLDRLHPGSLTVPVPAPQETRPKMPC